eukprot:CAMPEP_0171141904 /NCGR_PEP_ID=MMETSP0766_2-20121228/141463_1 /TAXON_ID=439317 /ORGANISM="Gambierdiscus australes, Strain CAWD 149" /LENGTH=147 /DNA_ID=CAMNT_0011605657 /DNA_START=1 /DNA_END=444 /DNA_ORIENTATION=-
MVLRCSPAKFVAVVVAAGGIGALGAALQPQHPLLYSRVRAVCVQGGTESAGGKVPKELEGAVVGLPEDHLRLFELLQELEERWQRREAGKYNGLRGLKENDVPGLRRISMEKRIERLDRDRNDDELARLLRKHEQNQEDSEEEPGVD